MDSTELTPSEKVYDTLFSHIEKRSLKIDDLLQLTTAAMELVQKIRELSGPEKKAVVLEVILKAVDNKLVPKSIRPECRELTKTILPKTIDLLVSAYRHEIDLKKVKENCGCFALKH